MNGKVFAVSIKENAEGYQGYKGLGWFGLAMVPIKEDKDTADGADTLKGVDIKRSRILSPHIQGLMQQVEDLNRALKFLIFNGTILI